MTKITPNPSAEAPILVLGGSGHIGRHIVSSLLAAGISVRVVSRNPDQARTILGSGPEIIAGDITSETTLSEALQDIRRIVFSLSAFTPQLIRRQWEIEYDAVLAILERAQSAGVRRIVYLSGYELRPDLIDELDLEFGRIKLAVESAIRNSEFNWTILGLAPSLEIFFATLRGNRLVFPGGGPPAFPAVSQLDAGAVAAQAVLRDDLSGRRICVPGPETLSFPEAARRIAAVWDRPIVFRKVPLAPLRIAGFLTRYFNPYLYQLAGSARLLNRFPDVIAARVPEDFRNLSRTFNYTPTTLEMEAKRRKGYGNGYEARYEDRLR